MFDTTSFNVQIAVELEDPTLAIVVQFFINTICSHKRANRNLKKGKTWNYCTYEELIEYFPYWTQKQIRSRIDKLVEKKVLIVGDFNKSKWDHTNWYAFQDEEKWGISKVSYVCPNGQIENQKRADLIPLPNSLPTLAKAKGNALKGMPSSIEELGIAKEAKVIFSKTRKFKRKKDHQELFEWLMSLSLTDENGWISEDDMSVLSHKHSKKQLEDAYYHLKFRMNEKSFKPKSLIASFKHFLKKEHNPRGSNCEENKKIAEEYCKEMGWNSLEIHDKYVEDRNFPGKDISLNMDPMEFFECMVNLYNSLKG